MAGILCDGGIARLNNVLTNAMADAGYVVRLFSNNHTPDVTDVLADYTEATFPGYVEGTLIFDFNAGVSGNIDTCGFIAVTFTRIAGAGSETIFGYYIVDPSDGQLIGAQVLPVPVVISTAGQAIVINNALTYQDRSIA